MFEILHYFFFIYLFLFGGGRDLWPSVWIEEDLFSVALMANNQKSLKVLNGFQNSWKDKHKQKSFFC